MKRRGRDLRAINGVGARVAVVAIVVAAVALAILAGGVIVAGAAAFANLMETHGFSTSSSDDMFRASVVQVLLVALVVAVAVAVLLAVLLGRRLGRPLRAIDLAARRVAGGAYETRIAPQGPAEIASLADSFNQMAAAIAEQERTRREFIANAAHELRTPLTNLKGYLEALRDGVMEPDRATFESLWEETERLVRLARALDTLAEGDAGSPPRLIRLDVAEAIMTAVDLVRPAVQTTGLDVAVDVPAGLEACADPDQLARVLGNLLQNAVRYTPAGGHVRIEGERRVTDVRVSISNTGDGIPAGDLPHVFERFYRVDKSRDRAHGGAGIGLAIVRQLVEGFGGEVGAESAPGTTRFWFTLPRAGA